MEGLTGNPKKCLWFDYNVVLNGGEDKEIRWAGSWEAKKTLGVFWITRIHGGACLCHE